MSGRVTNEFATCEKRSVFNALAAGIGGYAASALHLTARNCA